MTAERPDPVRYVEDVRERLAAMLGRFYPGWVVEVGAAGAFPDTVITITTETGVANATFKVWNEDWNDREDWDEPSFLASELFRSYEAGDRS